MDSQLAMSKLKSHRINAYRSWSSFPWMFTNRILSNFPDILKYQAFVEDPAVGKIIHSIQADLVAVKEIESRIAAATRLGFPQKINL